MDFIWSRDIKLPGDISKFDTSGTQIPQSPGFPGLKKKVERVKISIREG